MNRGPVLGLCLVAAACRDLSSFSTGGDRYEGGIVAGDFVRSGLGAGVTGCLALDADHLQDLPGALSTDDGLFARAALRPIPQIWHDPLSTFSFGEGRLKNLLYVATPSAPLSDGRVDDVFVVLSLMQSGHVEVRLLHGAPGGAADAAAGANGNLFGVFDLARAPGPCSY